jgi:sortase A
MRGIHLGDEIRFRTLEQNFEYVVESIEVVAPSDIQVLEVFTGHDLTFITCFPFYYVGPAPKRFVVRAREVENMPQRGLARE